MSENLFEKASRLKLRFQAKQGLLSVEDLWDLSLSALDMLAQSVNRELQSETEVSFLPTKRKATSHNGMRLELLKYVISVRVDEADKAKVRAEKRAKLDMLRSLAETKAVEQFASQSLDEIKRQIADLESDV